MRPPSRFGWIAAALVALFLLVGPAGAEPGKPPVPQAGPQIFKMSIFDGPVPTVSYTVVGGSPHLQALVKTLEFTENEMLLTGQLQQLRIGMAANERTLNTLQTWQQLGMGPISTPGSAPPGYPPPAGSALQAALVPQLAQESTPFMAYQLINIWEQVQTELQLEQGHMVAAAPGAPAVGQNAQPAAPAAVPAPAAPMPAPPRPPVMVPQAPVPPAPTAFQQAAPQQDALQQQILQMQQQIMQNTQQMVRQTQRLTIALHR